jgi:hypothetical protein
VAGQPEDPVTIDFGRFKVVRHRRELLADGLPVELGGRAFDTLIALIEARGTVLSKDELMSRVWPDRVVEENNLAAQISGLRKVLWCLAELLRTRGELHLLERVPTAVETAEKCFHRALDLARDQGALSWELRSAMSLARLWHGQQRVCQARKLLAPVYRRFTGGFGTADLIAAETLLASVR